MATSDENYTPARDYDVVKKWVRLNYGIQFGQIIPESAIVRPFYPGGDYMAVDYRGKIVIDNPPFSKLAEIVEFYKKNGVKFFLWAPGNKACRKWAIGLCSVIIGLKRHYEGAGVIQLTSFVTNLFDYDIVLAGGLYYYLTGHYMKHKTPDHARQPLGVLSFPDLGRWIPHDDVWGRAPGREYKIVHDYGFSGGIDFTGWEWGIF